MLCLGAAERFHLVHFHTSFPNIVFICDLQVCGGYPDALGRTAQLIDDNISVDFVDVNMGENMGVNLS